MKIPLIALLALSGAVHGQTLTQSLTLPTYTASGTSTAAFQQFDTLGGTRALTGVTVSFSFDKTGGEYQVDNDSPVGGAITFYHELRGRLESTDVNIGANGTYRSALSEFDTAVGPNNGDPEGQFDAEPGGTDYYIFHPTPILGTGNSSAISSTYWAAYTGTGTFDITFRASQIFGVDGIGGLQSQTIASMVTPTITVTYDYAMVPEPVSASLLGIAGIAFAARRRRIA